MRPAPHEILEQFFARYITVNRALSEWLRSSFIIKEFPQHSVLTAPGQVEKYFYVVVEGVQALYISDKNGNKVILGFSYRGSPSGVFDSFIKQQASSFFVEAITPSTLMAIPKAKYDEAFQHFPEMMRWKSDFMEDILFGRISREVEMMTKSAHERYDAFMARCPADLKVIPQKYLASYLHMQPETFSRLRAIQS